MGLKTPQLAYSDKAIGRIVDALGALNSALKDAGMDGGVTEIRMPKKDLQILDRFIMIYLSDGYSVSKPNHTNTLIQGIRFMKANP